MTTARDDDLPPVKLNDQHLRSHGIIGDCEQSTFVAASHDRLQIIFFFSQVCHQGIFSFYVTDDRRF